MSAALTMARARDAAAAFWNDRSIKERKQMLAIGSVILAALIYLLLLEPALHGRAQLRKSLPELRQQSAELQQLTQQAAALGANVATPPPLLSKQSIEAGLTARGLKAQSVVVTDEVVRIQLNTASFAALVEWLDEVQKTARLSVMDSTITGLPDSDTVSATLTMRQQKSDASGG